MYYSNLNPRLPQLPNQYPSTALRSGYITTKNPPIDPPNNPRTTLPRTRLPKRIQHFPYPSNQCPLHSSYISNYPIHSLYTPRPSMDFTNRCKALVHKFAHALLVYWHHYSLGVRGCIPVTLDLRRLGWHCDRVSTRMFQNLLTEFGWKIEEWGFLGCDVGALQASVSYVVGNEECKVEEHC